VKPEHIVAVVLRLFAIVLTIYTVNSFVGSAWFYFASGATTGVSVLLVVVTLVMLATAFLLWRFPLWIASRLVGFDSSVSRASISIPADELQTVAFTVVGIYLLFKAVVSGVYWVSWYGARGQAYAIDPREWASMLTTIAEFVLACFLVFGQRNWGQ
jgi:hypothetical protein